MRREFYAVSEIQLEREDFELQLKVWKDLAISKQVLMQTAAKSLGLTAECTTEELEIALNKTITQVNGLQAELNEARERAASEIEKLNSAIEIKDKSIKKLTAERDEALSGKEAAEHRTEAGRATNSEELKKAKAQVVQKDKELKNITKILADTPENVVKKLKTLKKEKMDEANLRKKSEENARRLRKEKQEKEAELKESTALVDNAAELATQVRELHQLANSQYDKLAESVDDKSELTVVPALNEDLIKAYEKNEDEDKGKKAKKS